MKIISQIFFVAFLLEYSHQSPVDKLHDVAKDYDVVYTDYDYYEFETKIVSGKNAGKHEFPSLVAFINDNGIQFCGGTLIHKRFVATAAHCFRGK